LEKLKISTGNFYELSQPVNRRIISSDDNHSSLKDRFISAIKNDTNIYHPSQIGISGKSLKPLQYPLDPVLNPETCLREDHFGYMQGDKPFFRKLGGIYGVAQPNLKGLEEIFSQIGGEGQKVVWVSLRAEPVVYLKGEPYSPKGLIDIDANLPFPGASIEQVEAQERLLKKEILQKIHQGEPLAFCTSDSKDKACHYKFAPGELKPQDIKTVTEIFQEFAQRYQLDYHRIPIDDLHQPEPRDFDAMVEQFKDFDPQAAYMANCMGGWGRTTTTMAAFSVMRTCEGLYRPEPGQSGSWRKAAQDGPRGDYREDKIQRLASKLLNKAIDKRVIKDGKSREFIAIIEEQAHIGCHLEKEISRAAQERPDRVQEYTERYLALAFFYQYCREQSRENYSLSFSQWVKPHRKEIKAIALALTPLFKGEAGLKKKLGVKP